jgi:small subunit ribosomal protein S16
MLTIRMQRTGRKGHAMFRVVVQDSRQAPTSGKTVALLGSYDPHSKAASLNKEKAAFYLEHGAQPSDRAAYLLKKEGVKLPKWVKEPAKKERAVRNAEKRRSTAPEQPAEEPAEAATETPEESPAEAPAENTDAPASEPDAAPAEEKPAEQPAAKSPEQAPDKAENEE